MIDSMFAIFLTGALLFISLIVLLSWWDLNGYKVIERRRRARQVIIDKEKRESDKPQTQ